MHSSLDTISSNVPQCGHAPSPHSIAPTSHNHTVQGSRLKFLTKILNLPDLLESKILHWDSKCDLASLTDFAFKISQGKHKLDVWEKEERGYV